MGAVDRMERIIYGYAVITRGEALGHGVWVDSEMLDQVVAAGNALPKGAKTRFTHPGLCSDGLGKYLGRSRNFRRDGDVVRANLHLSVVAGKSPEATNDPAEYIMAFAEEDPDAFGSSIVFWPDQGAMVCFADEHEDEDGEFQSPDELNVRNLPHGRLAKLDACDIVGDPAANPGGFFSSGDESAARAEQVLSWVFGLTEVAPAPETLGGGQPNRIREFVNGFMARHDLVVVPAARPTQKEAIMPNQNKSCALQGEGGPAYCVCKDCGYSEDYAGSPCGEKTCPTCGNPLVGADEKPAAPVEEPAAPVEESRPHWKALKAAFPTDRPFAIQCFDEGLSLAAAQAKFASVTQARLAEQDAEVRRLREENAGLRTQMLGGAAPVSHLSDPDSKTFTQIVSAYKVEKSCSTEDAIRMCRLTHPDVYKAAEAAGTV